MKFSEDFTMEELRIIKDLLTSALDSLANPVLPKMLSKDLAYLKPDKFEGDLNKIVTMQTALRKTIEEIILRRVHEDS